MDNSPLPAFAGFILNFLYFFVFLNLKISGTGVSLPQMKEIFRWV